MDMSKMTSTALVGLRGGFDERGKRVKVGECDELSRWPGLLTIAAQVSEGVSGLLSRYSEL